MTAGVAPAAAEIRRSVTIGLPSLLEGYGGAPEAPDRHLETSRNHRRHLQADIRGVERAVAIRDRIANYVIPELNAVALARHRVHHQRASAIELHGKRPQPPRLPWAGISAGTVVTGKWWSFRWVAGENLPPASPGHEDVHGESDYRQFLAGRPVSDTLEYL